MTNTEKRLEDKLHTFITASNCACCKQMGSGCSLAHLNSGEIKECFATSIAQARAEERERVVEFIKDKSEKVTNDLWYVADQCLEDIPRFFSPLTD